MKLEQSEHIQILSIGEDNSINSTIDSEDVSFILHTLSSNLYANPVESLIREYTTNAWDAHIESGIDKPIIVTLDTDTQGSFWSVRDFGSGLSPEKIKDIYTKFGKSTKRKSNDQHGLFGIGKFSGLSYTNNVYIITIVDSIKYMYSMFKDDSSIKTDLLFQQETNEENGTEIKIVLNDYSDLHEFIKGCKSQLAYFENIYYNSPHITNSYKIITNEKFRFSELYAKDDMHLTLGEVVYPLPWSDLGIKMPIIAPVGIRFNIGELSVTPNRESILMKGNSKDIIVSRLKKVCNELVDLYNKQSSDTDDIDVYFKNITNTKLLNIGNKNIKMDGIALFSNIKVSSYKFTKLPKINDYNISIATLGFPYVVTSALNSFTGFKMPTPYELFGNSCHGYKQLGTALTGGSYMSYQYRCLPIQKLPTVFYATGSFHGTSITTLRYIYEAYGISKIVLLNKNASLNEYVYYLNLKKVSRDKWRAVIKEYQSFINSYIKELGIEIHDLSTIKPTKEWIALDKARRKKKVDYHSIRKSQNKILIYKPRANDRWSHNSLGVYDKEEIVVSNLINPKCLYIYGTLDQKDSTLNTLFFKTNKKIKGLMLAKVNTKYIDGLPGYISLNKFMEGKNRFIGRVVTAHIILEYFQENRYLLNAQSFIENLNTEYGKTIYVLSKYVEDNVLIDPNNTNATHKEFLKEIKEVAKKTRWYDYHALNQLEYIKKYADSLKFIKNLKGYKDMNLTHGTSISLLSVLGCISKDQLEFAAEYIKFKKKFRLNKEYYVTEKVAELTDAELLDDNPDLIPQSDEVSDIEEDDELSPF